MLAETANAFIIRKPPSRTTNAPWLRNELSSNPMFPAVKAIESRASPPQTKASASDIS